MILLDTDVCVELLRGNQAVIEKRMFTDEDVAVSFMTVGELYYGAKKSNNPTKNSRLVEKLLLSIDILHTDLEILTSFGNLKADLNLTGKTLPDADIFIAATAITKCTRLITGNRKHFQRFDKLTIENWIR